MSARGGQGTVEDVSPARQSTFSVMRSWIMASKGWVFERLGVRKAGGAKDAGILLEMLSENQNQFACSPRDPQTNIRPTPKMRETLGYSG